MKQKNKKDKIDKHFPETGSKKSYERDPALKDLAYSLQNRSGDLRQEENINSIDDTGSFEKSYLTDKEISLFAKNAGNLPELKSEFKESLNKIATSFRSAFASLKDYDEVNFQIQKILIESFFQTARALAVSVEARDPYTGGHSDRVFQIAKELGKRCNISTTEQLYLEGGALLHDIGKISIRDNVLLKPGPLTDLEYKEMQLHTIIGAQIVKKLNCLLGCTDVVLFHHERMDGYGYPYGIKGKEIPFIARITSVADAYDAMTTNRIYRKALSHEHALEEIIRNSGTQFDPDVVKVFIKWWEETFQKNPQKSKELYKNVLQSTSTTTFLRQSS